MAETTQYVNKLIDLAKPRTEFKLMKPNIDKAHAAYEKLELSPTADKDKEAAFNKAAAAYLAGAFGIGYDDPTVAGGQIKNYLARLPNGSEILENAYNAIKSGDKQSLESALKTALESLGRNKLESLAQEIRDQSEDVRNGVYGGLAELIAEFNGYKGSALSVGENFSGAINLLRQRVAGAEAFGKPKK